MKKRKILFIILAVIGVIAMFFFSGQNADASGALSMGLAAKLFGWTGIPAAQLDHIVRKAAHALLFMGEGFCVRMIIDRALPSLGLCALMAVINELQQLFSTGRSCEVRDMCIDTAGALVGIWLAAGLIALCHRFYKQHLSIRRDDLRHWNKEKHHDKD